MKKILVLASLGLLPLLSSAQQTQWFHLDPKSDNAIGISTDRTYRELLKGRKPTPVVVAVIDGGVDTTHEDLKRVLWINPKEVAGNGVDDDKNGYVDDVHGWNFIGGKDGRNVSYETTEVTRIYNRLKPKFEGVTRASLKPAQQQEYDLYVKVRDEVEKKRSEYQQQYVGIGRFAEQFMAVDAELKKALNVTRLDTATLRTANLTDPLLKRRAAGLYQLLSSQGVADSDAFKRDIEKAVTELKGRAEYMYNPEFNARSIVGDRPDDLTERYYGNADITGPRADHGTHVAGIIAADRANTLGVLGVADAVRIMGVRAVPDGDERDKDVANAIRYAVDNGAQIINMSFGKDYSPERQVVDEAIRYAEKKGVLLVHAAGNDGKNLDSTNSYPATRYSDGREIPNMLTVGASARSNDQALVASFSNYGKRTVDVFAPGKDIYSTTPGSQYESNSGTSMAAPVVSGVAAVLKAYFPKLTYADLKRIIMQSATPYSTSVQRPESEDSISFSELSKTGAIVNLYEAVKLALAQEAGTGRAANTGTGR